MGILKEEAAKIDLTHAFLQMKKHYARRIAEDISDQPALRDRVLDNMSALLDRKLTLITRPMEHLLANPHLLSGWLSINIKNFRIDNGKVFWLRNPLGVLNETYEYLHMSYRANKPAADVIWSHDNELLQQSIRFYVTLRERFGLVRGEYFKLNRILDNDEPQGDFDAETWDRIRSAHFGYEGMHFEKGQPLYIIEVMKMFNKISVPFSGTIDRILVTSGDGAIVHKGQPLFKVTPDELFEERDPAEIKRERHICTSRYLSAVL